MKNSNLDKFTSLLHTDWHPEKGDFIKENSLNDSAQFNKRLRNRNIMVGSLIGGIILVFIIAILVLSV